MKKIVLVLVVILLGAGTAAWTQRDELILAVIKFRTARTYADVAPTRAIPWQQGPEQPAAGTDSRPPNIVLIVADDLGYNDISTFGGGVSGAPGGPLQTPAIDRLAREGAVFTQSYSGASTCAPSRAMMMTGRYPTRTGFEFTPLPPGMASTMFAIGRAANLSIPPSSYDRDVEKSHPPFSEKGLPASEVTIAEVLREQGYYTAHIGKWHLGRENGMAPHEQGFEDSLLMQNGLYLPVDHPEVVNAELPFDLMDRFLWAGLAYSASFNSGNQDRFRPGGYLTDYWTDEAVRVIEANRNRPFFLYLAHWGPHTPLQSTRADYEAVGAITPHRKRVYAGMVRAIDRSVSRVLDALEEQGVADNTLVMFTSDNGGPGYIRIPDVNSPFRGWKITMFEGGIRVPMFIRWPSQIPAGTVVDTPVAHIDVMPTLAAAADASTPSDLEIDGENILPLASTADTVSWDRETLFWQNGHYQVVRHGDWKLQVNDRPTDGLQRWLYNLAEDPTERVNLAASRQDKLDELTALLAAHQAGSRGPLYPPIINTVQLIDKDRSEGYVAGDEYVYTPN